MNTVVAWSLLEANGMEIYLAATEHGLCYVSYDGDSYDKLRKWCTKNIGDHRLIRHDSYMGTYRDQLGQYLSGTRKSFEFSVYLYGTDFQREVWSSLVAIPYGETWSYSDVAKFINNQSAIRAVGSALGENPVPIVLPCHRVLSKGGGIGGFRGGLDMKRILLDIEKPR